jgi:hypothetical protein
MNDKLEKVIRSGNIDDLFTYLKEYDVSKKQRGVLLMLTEQYLYFGKIGSIETLGDLLNLQYRNGARYIDTKQTNPDDLIDSLSLTLRYKRYDMAIQLLSYYYPKQLHQSEKLFFTLLDAYSINRENTYANRVALTAFLHANGTKEILWHLYLCTGNIDIKLQLTENEKKIFNGEIPIPDDYPTIVQFYGRSRVHEICNK